MKEIIADIKGENFTRKEVVIYGLIAPLALIAYWGRVERSPLLEMSSINAHTRTTMNLEGFYWYSSIFMLLSGLYLHRQRPLASKRR